MIMLIVTHLWGHPLMQHWSRKLNFTVKKRNHFSQLSLSKWGFHSNKWRFEHLGRSSENVIILQNIFKPLSPDHYVVFFSIFFCICLWILNDCAHFVSSEHSRSRKLLFLSLGPRTEQWRWVERRRGHYIPLLSPKLLIAESQPHW